jgi:hypothetical protein
MDPIGKVDLPSGHNSAVECQLPKLGVAGSNPVARSFPFPPVLPDL